MGGKFPLAEAGTADSRAASWYRRCCAPTMVPAVLTLQAEELGREQPLSSPRALPAITCSCQQVSCRRGGRLCGR